MRLQGQVQGMTWTNLGPTAGREWKKRPLEVVSRQRLNLEEEMPRLSPDRALVELAVVFQLA